ncbi:hypothetical protein EVAR_54997_1 [Eumeta japonica]|uniref:PiggyBac transposable element-derived protein domain-containing protein n=1 Tax=Eumeta variegata TaxID=151549 RepID=A0A4C1Z4L1_EUMVA|nr:hypothetical protein EVAR_54997_1 [Eumeta japonica]
MDNYYNSPALARYLKCRGFDCLGTERLTRKNIPEDVKEMKKNCERARSLLATGDVMVLAGCKILSMISTFHDNSTYTGTSAGEESVRSLISRSELRLDRTKTICLFVEILVLPDVFTKICHKKSDARRKCLTESARNLKWGVLTPRLCICFSKNNFAIPVRNVIKFPIRPVQIIRRDFLTFVCLLASDISVGIPLLLSTLLASSQLEPCEGSDLAPSPAAPGGRVHETFSALITVWTRD